MPLREVAPVEVRVGDERILILTVDHYVVWRDASAFACGDTVAAIDHAQGWRAVVPDCFDQVCSDYWALLATVNGYLGDSPSGRGEPIAEAAGRRIYWLQ